MESRGTKVSVTGIFHRLPVRLACLRPNTEIAGIERLVRGIALNHPTVGFTLGRASSSAAKAVILQTKQRSSCYRTFLDILALTGSSVEAAETSMRQVRYAQHGLSLRGLISLVNLGSTDHNSNDQYFSINKR